MNLKLSNVKLPRLRLLKANQPKEEMLRRLKTKKMPPKRRETKSSVR